MKRRDFLLGAGALAGVSGGVGMARAAAPVRYDLAIQPAEFALRDQVTRGMVSLSPDAPPPVIVGQQGVPMVLNVTNRTPDFTTMHWHGMRIPNAMDGVPYLTQFPVGEDEVFTYEFTPPDAGTYWYHPHCVTMQQMAHGLTGVLVIEEADDPGFDGDQAVNLRDFRLADDGSFLPSYTGRGAAESGTFGNVRMANWMDNPVYDQPAGGLVRLRVVNTDTTRVYEVYLAGAEAQVIAWDGHPVREPVAMPDAENLMWIGPGQRADFAVRMPSIEGQEVQLIARIPGGNKVMAGLRAVGADLGRQLGDVPVLAQNPVSMPDLDAAEMHEFVFSWTPEGGAPDDGACGSLGYSFWAINHVPWPGDAAEGTGPLAVLERGKSYILRLRNDSPMRHPVHLHGLAMLPLQSTRKVMARNWTDTVLLEKGEIVDVALVADNPGDWAFHCHVIEHQKTGLSGFIRVT